MIEELRPVPEAHRGLPASFERGLGGAGDEVGGGGVVDAVAGVDGFEAERDREHRLADAGWPDREDVRVFFDEAQRRELFDEAAVDRGLGGEVEVLEGLGGGEPGEAQAAGEAPFERRLDFDFEEVVQELGVAGLVVLGVLERGGEPLSGRGELQRGEVPAELLVGRVLVHRATPAIRA